MGIKDKWKVDNLVLDSRLLVGTGRFENALKAKQSIEISQTNMITVAVRRMTSSTPNNSLWTLLEQLNHRKLWILPNTAGSKTADEAIRLAFLGREMMQNLGQFDNNFLKLEVIADAKYLMPDPIGTIKAADYLIKKGFRVFPYMNADPSLGSHLEELGCVTLMPLGSAIGSNQGIKSLENLRIIIKESKIPVIVDAGIGKPSDASKAMELGASAVLINTAIAGCKRPELMAESMRLAVLAGRLAYLAKDESITIKKGGASSPKIGLPF
uniref:thiazole synthase n=1 Tax=Eustigmatophyceae sp. Mont 10/10-1w TaxID=2506145 RepID=A0A3R5WX39_9STRA|nr:Thiamine biosynthesis protein G [Eustigmatophyceae sp. Mont 10/10-1w]YP_009550839.1 Thiamine biosynthesis protein G [Eustigmatophyceae sp. Mont 10/10-1w]QAA11711.1 Thiamine biosynthesis protein G [Eustigmatophyceae sp. Mont 10/10-1w]QAA11768.1 Thiamine biosynthesis protein G [Eustigmatophyceae sp. Mont 10/10-1w]